ncbi:tryptophan--tRNA ligase [Caldifermentibacillus hisashii]|jgi:tryptophanyl-tRNA synthetase|uniref:tryptophan--tRNA ligase n=1 Tax=Caldifermentibacillus hisashii TaxID=996558 RepID=UPI0031FBE632
MRLLTGDRPTGKLHLGHYVGTIKNRVKYQYDYDCLFIIADLHMLTTKRSTQNIKDISANARSAVLDMISCGIDPYKSRFYLQSGVMDIIGSIYFLMNNLITVNRLNRVPSLKDMANDINEEMPYGLLGYPVLQAIDILGYKANIVPVGKDNISHVEVTREIAKRFNNEYGEVFPIPEPVIGIDSSLVGIDGKRKMSKSLGNSIYISDNDEEITAKVMKMPTDPNRIRPDIPGKVEGNTVFIYHDLFNKNKQEVEELKERYRAGKIGDVEVKKRLSNAIINYLEPFRERRREYESVDKLNKLIADGTFYAREEFYKTYIDVVNVMGYNKVWQGFNLNTK